MNKSLDSGNEKGGSQTLPINCFGFAEAMLGLSKRMHWPVPLVGLLLLISSNCGISGEGANTRQTAHKETGVTAENDLQKFSKYARAFEWVARTGSIIPDLKCDEFLRELRSPTTLRQVRPRVEAKSADDSELIEVSRCASYRTKERADAAVPNNFITGARDFGDLNFQLYRVKSGRNPAKVWDIIYGEYLEEKVLTNAYFDGFNIVNLQNCTRSSGVPIQNPGQRSTKGDTRQILKGLFEYNGRALVITATEQVGHSRDPESFRAIDVWPLKDDGQFTVVCGWVPKRLAEQVNSGVKK